MPTTPTLLAPSAGASDAAAGDAGRTLAGLKVLAGDAEAAERRFFQGAAAYAIAHPAEQWDGSDGSVETVEEVVDLDASAVGEFACATSRTYLSALGYLMTAKECATRLPRLWARVGAGEVAVFRARAIAETTSAQSAKVADHVDRCLAPYAHSCSLAQIRRTVDAAIAAHDPQQAAERAAAEADTRHVTVHHGSLDVTGTLEVTARLDAADARDLDHALADIAADLRAAGSEDSLDVRRSIALGELGRKQLALEFPHLDPDTGEITAPDPAQKPRHRRDLTLYVHLSQAAIDTGVGIGRCENSRTALTLDQIKSWCQTAGTKVLVRPVLDAGAVRHVDAYEATHLMREAVIIRDTTCVGPYCHLPARRTDLDHIQPYDHDDPTRGGPTTTDNIGCLCRRHHRLKTHRGWTYEPITDPDGTTAYLWTTPSGGRYLRTPTGTRPLL